MKCPALITNSEFKVFLLCWLLALGCCAAEPVTLDFLRPKIKGARYDCNITAELFKKTTFQGASGASAVRHTVLVNLDGEMLITGVTAAGQAAGLDFKVARFDGEYNGRKIQSSRTGQVLGVEFPNSGKPRFFIRGDKYVPLSDAEKLLLSLIFQPSPSDGLKTLLGPGVKVAMGGQWTPPIESFTGLFARHGVKFFPEQVKAAALLKEKTRFKGIECWVIEETLKTADIADFQFNFNLRLLLPVDPAKGGPVKMERQSVWRAAAGLPADDPLSTGSRIASQVVSSLNVTSLPLPSDGASVKNIK